MHYLSEHQHECSFWDSLAYARSATSKLVWVLKKLSHFPYIQYIFFSSFPKFLYSPALTLPCTSLQIHSSLKLNFFLQGFKKIGNFFWKYFSLKSGLGISAMEPQSYTSLCTQQTCCSGNCSRLYSKWGYFLQSLSSLPTYCCRN